MKQFFKFDASSLNKKKLIAIFGAIVIVAVVFLYYENIYNLTHRSKNLLESSFSISSSKDPPNKLNIDEQKQINELQKEKNRNNDNKNNENVTKCWEVEIFQIIEPCSKCDSFAKSSLKACKSTGYREILNCEKYGLVSRRCLKPERVVLKQYWTFQIVSLLLAIIFTVIAKKRKKHLDKLATERVRKQLLSG